jgi:quinol monooxygenase YgiN
VAGSEPGALLYRAHRSRIDPDLFLLYETYPDERALERHAHAPGFDALLRQAADQGLVAAADDDPPEVELYETI